MGRRPSQSVSHHPVHATKTRRNNRTRDNIRLAVMREEHCHGRMIARVLFFLLLAPWWAMASDYNAVVLEQISRIPAADAMPPIPARTRR